MKLKQTLIAVAIALVPVSAFAAGSLDVFYINQDLDADGKDSGDGYGIRGAAVLGQGLSLTGMLQDAELDDFDINLRETRIGLSYDTKSNGIEIGAGLESVALDFNQSGPGSSLRGYSVNGHASISPMDKVSLYARVGYTNVDELDGMEYEVGASFAACKDVTVFTEYRMAKLNDEGFGSDFDLDTLRIGARHNF